MVSQEEWERLSPEEKRIQLYLKQKALLRQFLKTGAISQAQYDKSFGDMTEKMGMWEYADDDSNANFTPDDKKGN